MSEDPEEKERAELSAEETPKADESEGTEKPVEGEQSTEKPEETGEKPEVNDLDAFMKEAGLTDEADGNDGSDAKSKTDTPSGNNDEEINRRIQEAEERARREERESVNQQRQRDGVRNSFNERTRRIRAWANSKIQRNEPITPQDVENLVVEFEQHHGQSQQLAKEDAASELMGQWSGALFEAAEKKFPGIKSEVDGTPDFVDKIVNKAREGYVSQADAKEMSKKTLREFRAYLESKGLLQAAKEVPGGGNNNGVTGRKPDAVLEDSDATPEDKRKAFKEKYGFEPDW